MKKITLIVVLLVSCIWCQSQVPLVTLDGKDFKFGGTVDYLKVMNYSIDMTGIYPNYYIAPYCLYDATGFFEFNNKTDNLNQLKAHFSYLVSNNFNCIRVNGVSLHYNDPTTKFSFDTRDLSSWPMHNIYFTSMSYNNTEFQIFADLIKQIMDAATSVLDVNTQTYKPLYIIFNFTGNEENADNPTCVAKWKLFYENISAYINTLPNKNIVLGFDLYNEPSRADTHRPTKYEVCDFMSGIYDIIKAINPERLVTIGVGEPTDVWKYDPGVIKLDFLSLHLYPYFTSGDFTPDGTFDYNFEDPHAHNVHPYTQEKMLQRVLDQMYWYHENSPYPWIIGEKGYLASEDNVDPYFFLDNGDWGTFTLQYNYFQGFLQGLVNSGGSGYSLWNFQDDPVGRPNESHFGMLKGSQSIGASAEKPFANLFKTFPNFIVAGSPPTTYTDTYDMNSLYYNAGSYPANPAKTITGHLYDQDGNPISNGVISGHALINYDNQGTIGINENFGSYLYTHTDVNGLFNLIPYDFVWHDHDVEDFYTLYISAPGAERLKFGDDGLNVATTPVMPLPNANVDYNLNKEGFTFNNFIHDITLSVSSQRLYKGNNSLTTKNILLNNLSVSTFNASKDIIIMGDFDAVRGSYTDIICEAVEFECGDYNGYSMPAKPNLIRNEKSDFISNKIIINFEKDKQLEVLIFPNPTHNKFAINIANSSSDTIKFNEIAIFNKSGQLCKRYNSQLQFPFYIDISDLVAGTYDVELITESAIVYYNKIIKL